MGGRGTTTCGRLGAGAPVKTADGGSRGGNFEIFFLLLLLISRDVDGRMRRYKRVRDRKEAGVIKRQDESSCK